MTLNKDHPFYRKIYAPALADGRTQEAFNLECLVLAVARAEAAETRPRAVSVMRRNRREWSNALAAFLGA